MSNGFVWVFGKNLNVSLILATFNVFLVFLATVLRAIA